MTSTRPGGIPPPRHIDFLAFSAPLMDCSCRKLAHGAQIVRREQSLCSKKLRKFLQMPGWWYPSRTSTVMRKTPTFSRTLRYFLNFIVNDATFAFGACGLSAHTAPIKMAIANHVEQPFAQNHHLPESKCRSLRLCGQTFGRFSQAWRA